MASTAVQSLLSIFGAGGEDPNAAITSRTMNATRVISFISVASASAATAWEPFGELSKVQKITVWGMAFLLLGAVVIVDMWARAHTTAASMAAEVVIVTQQLSATVTEGGDTQQVKVVAFRQTGGLMEFLVVRDLAGGQVDAQWCPSTEVAITGT